MPTFGLRVRAIVAVLVLIALVTTLITADSEGGDEGIGSSAEIGEASGIHAFAGIILALLVLVHMAINYKTILNMGRSFLPKKGKE